MKNVLKTIMGIITMFAGVIILILAIINDLDYNHSVELIIGSIIFVSLVYCGGSIIPKSTFEFFEMITDKIEEKIISLGKKGKK